MGSEYSIQSSPVHGKPGVLATKLEGIAKEKPAGKSSPDITRGTKTCLGEGEMESQNTNLERTPEMQLAGESLPDVAQGTPNNGFGEDNIEQTDKYQNETDTLSLPNETKEVQILDVDPMKEAMPASEVKIEQCCTGDATEDHYSNLNSLQKGQCTEQVCELNVRGQPHEKNLVQQELSTTQEKSVVSRGNQTANRKLVCFLLNETDFHTMNVSKESSVDDLETRHPVVITQPTATPPPQVTEQLWCCGVEKPFSAEELAKAIPDDQALEIAEERRPQKTTQTIYTGMAVTPVVTQQPRTQMRDAPQYQVFNGDVSDLQQYVGQLGDGPEEEGKCRICLLPEKKKSSCCNVL
nr:PREDICTED: uncharacterized protein LOC103280445 [Anolis carolinensis]|eukprot:XP_016852461.1 PREDICTED: uncharacterized protein LOC103280445 [Anolis carolinensis]